MIAIVQEAQKDEPREKIKVPKKFQPRFDRCNKQIPYTGTDMKCAYCGADLLADLDALMGATIDHIVPVSLGGSSQPSNLVAACYACNTLKADLPARNLREARQLVEAQRHFYTILLEALRAEYRD